MSLRWTDTTFTVALADCTIRRWATSEFSAAGPTQTFASVVGRLVWWHTATCRPLVGIASTLEILSGLARQHAQHYRLSDRQLATLRSSFAEAMRNEPREILPAPDSWMIAASDASDSRRAGVLFGNEVEFFARECTKEERRQHIFHKEVLAAVETAEFAAERRVKALLLLVDNTAAVACLSRGYSLVPSVRSVLARWLAVKRSMHISVQWISTEKQPADPPSRGESIWDNDGQLLPIVSAGWEEARKMSW